MHTTRTLGNPEPVTKSAFGLFLSFFLPSSRVTIFNSSFGKPSRGFPWRAGIGGEKLLQLSAPPPIPHLISDTLAHLSTIIQTLERRPKDLLYVWPPISIKGDNIEIHFITSVSTYFSVGWAMEVEECNDNILQFFTLHVANVNMIS